MSKYLVTGGAGFIGSHLLERLIAAGHAVVCLDDLSTGSLRNIEHLAGHPLLTICVGSVEDRTQLATAGAGVDGIFHLAAAVGVRLVVEDPIRTMQTNINGTAAVLAFARDARTRVVIASTSEIYGKNAKLPYAEDDDVTYGPTSKPRWSYAMSKAVDEFLLQAFARNHGLQATAVRLFNTAGPRQAGAYGMVVPRFIQQALSGGPIQVHGDGQQTRCFVHVLDVVQALTRLIELEHMDGSAVNIGSRERVSIQALAERVRQLVNPGVRIVNVPYQDVYGASFEDMRDREPDLNKAARLIGYAPQFTLDEILRDVWQYMRST